MLKQIFTIIRNNLRSNLLLMAGMFVISASLWYAVDYVYSVADNLRKPLGFDWEHVYYLQVGVLPQESNQWDDTEKSAEEQTSEYYTFLDRVRKHPAVENLCVTRLHYHYVWKNSNMAIYRDSLGTGTLFRGVTPEYFSVFRVKGADGTSPEQLAEKLQWNDYILSEDAADYLLNGKKMGTSEARNPSELVGEYITLDKRDGDSVRVAAVCEMQKYNEYGAPQRTAYSILKFAGGANTMRYAWAPSFDVFIRVKPEADNADFVHDFRREMKKQLRLGNYYLGDIKALSITRNEHLASFRSDLYSYFSIAGFFLVNAFLAILGTFWFRTQQRTEELAIRLVVGATPASLMQMLMLEGIILITLAYLPAMGLGYYLGNAEMVETWPTDWSMTRFGISSLLTYLMLLAVTLFSIWFPARKAMKIEPVEALHGE